MDIEVELALEVVGTELAEAVVSVLAVLKDVDVGWTYWASSQVTIGESPIFHIRVKNASAVNMSGAMRNS